MIKQLITLTIFIYFVQADNENQSIQPCKENEVTKLSDSEKYKLHAEPNNAQYQRSNTGSPSNNDVKENLQGFDYNFVRKNSEAEQETDNTRRKISDCEQETFKKVRHASASALEANAKSEELDSVNTNPVPINLVNNDQNINIRRKICSRNSLAETSPNTRRILPGIVENLTNQEITDYALNYNKQLNAHKIIKNHNMLNENEIKGNELQGQEDKTFADSIESRLMEPTKGEGISNIRDTRVMLLENSRVCYACSTMSDPTCWSPDRRTTVKYCRKGHQSCLTKTFKHQGASILIRDCGDSCVGRYDDKYNACSICHSDFCNGASALNIHNTSVAVIVLLVVYLSNIKE